MQTKTYPTESIEKVVAGLSQTGQALVRRCALMGTNLTLTMAKMTAVAAVIGPEPESRPICDAALGVMLTICASQAAADAASFNEEFDPVAFGQFAERIARECLPDFAQIDRNIAAEDSVATNN